MNAETDLQNRIRVAVAAIGTRLFRNNVGQAWQGAAKRTKLTGQVIIENAHPVRYGLCSGSSDLIGWTPVTITPDMVGQQVAVFTAIEVKEAGGRVSKEQWRFLEAVRDAGGIARVALTEQGAVDACLRRCENLKMDV